MYFMDNLARNMYCEFSRNSNSVLIKSSGEISVELHLAVQKIWPNTNFVFPSLNLLKLQGWERQLYLSRELKLQNLSAGIQRQHSGSEAAVPNILGVGAMPFSSTIPAPLLLPSYAASINGICPSSSWQEEKYSWKTREGIGTKRGGRDRFLEDL